MSLEYEGSLISTSMDLPFQAEPAELRFPKTDEEMGEQW